MKHQIFRRLAVVIVVLVSLYLLAVITLPAMFPGTMCALTRAPVEEVRVLIMAVNLYKDTYDSYPPSLATLGPPAPGQSVSSGSSGLISAELASGVWLGYTFRYIPTSARGRKSINGFRIIADPITEGPKKHHYFFDETGVLRAEKNRPATSASAPTHDSGCTCAAPEDFVGAQM